MARTHEQATSMAERARAYVGSYVPGLPEDRTAYEDACEIAQWARDYEELDEEEQAAVAENDPMPADLVAWARATEAAGEFRWRRHEDAIAETMAVAAEDIAADIAIRMGIDIPEDPDEDTEAQAGIREAAWDIVLAMV